MPSEAEFARARRLLASTAVLGLLVVGTATPASALQGTVPANVASSWQTNGAVSAITAANGVVYIGGDFTSVRPPGAAAGSSEVARNHLAAFNASTGALITSFNHNVNAARIAAFTASSGALTSFNPNANGSVAGRVAALNPSTGAALAGFTTTPDNVVYQIALKPQGNKLYLAGGFLSVNGNTVYQSVAVVDTWRSTTRSRSRTGSGVCKVNYRL